MKMTWLIGGIKLFMAASHLAADEINLESQSSAISASITLYRRAPSGFGEPLLSRQASDSSNVIGNRSASITTVAEAGGIRQTASDAVEIGLTNSEEGVTVRFETTIEASFSQDDAAEVRAGFTSVEVRSDFQLRFRLDRPHRATLTASPSSNRSLVGTLQAGIQSQPVTASATLSSSLAGPESRALTVRLEPGRHEMTVMVVSSGWGSFDLDQGILVPFAGEVGAIVSVVLEPIGGDDGSSSGRIEVSPPGAGGISLQLSELIPGRTYRVERAYNLVDGAWQFVRDVYSPSSIAMLTDSFDAQTNAVFYRLVLVE